MSENFAERYLRVPTAVGRFFIVIMNNIYCIPTYVIWMGLLIPLKRLNPDYYYKIEGIFFHWLLAIVSMWSFSAGYDIIEIGDDIKECLNKRTLVIANHQSTADVPLLMANFNSKENVLPNIMWIMDRLFKFTNFGIVSIIHQDFFIASGRSKRDESITALRAHMKNSFIKRKRNWIVLFPEGGFLRKRKEVSHRFAKKNDLPILDYVTLPRVGAIKAIVDALCENQIEHTNLHTTKSSTTTKTTTTSNLNNYNNKDNHFNCITNDNNDTNTIDNNENHQNIDDDHQIKCNNDHFNIMDSKNIQEQEDDVNIPRKRIDNLIIGNGNNNSNHKKHNLFISTTTGTGQNDGTNHLNTSDCQLDYILDITIAYPNGIPLDLPNILHGFRPPCQTYMLYRLYKMKDIPKDNSELLTNWLYQLFVEKNQLLANFYKTGEFYLDHRILNNLGTTIQQDFLRFLLINIFFITSTYLHYQCITKLYSYCYYLTHGNIS